MPLAPAYALVDEALAASLFDDHLAEVSKGTGDENTGHNVPLAPPASFISRTPNG